MSGVAKRNKKASANERKWRKWRHGGSKGESGNIMAGSRRNIMAYRNHRKSISNGQRKKYNGKSGEAAIFLSKAYNESGLSALFIWRMAKTIINKSGKSEWKSGIEEKWRQRHEKCASAQHRAITLHARLAQRRVNAQSLAALCGGISASAHRRASRAANRCCTRRARRIAKWRRCHGLQPA